MFSDHHRTQVPTPRPRPATSQPFVCKAKFPPHSILPRLATVVEANRVLVLEHGRLVELGDPQVLNHIRSTQILHHFLHIHNSDDLNNLHRSCCPTQAPTSVGWPPWPESPPSKPKYQCGSEGQELSVFTLFIYIMQSITRKEKHITE